jgi:hypothetical protein
MAPRIVGTDGLKLRIATAAWLTAMPWGWGMGDLALEMTAETVIDLAYRLERDTYQGVSRLQLRIADLRVSGPASAEPR